VIGLDEQTYGRMLSFPTRSGRLAAGRTSIPNPNIGGKRALMTGLTPSTQGGGAELPVLQAITRPRFSHFEDGKNLQAKIVSTLAPRDGERARRRVSGNNKRATSPSQNQPLELTWSASAADYGGEITGYRYGWDILDSANDEEWSSWSTANTSAQAGFVSASHSFWLGA
jgi:hypothetical protein